MMCTHPWCLYGTCESVCLCVCVGGGGEVQIITVTLIFIELTVHVLSIQCPLFLQRSTYVYVGRRGIQFPDTCELVYWCSCTIQSVTLIRSLHVNVCTPFSGIYE